MTIFLSQLLHTYITKYEKIMKKVKKNTKIIMPHIYNNKKSHKKKFPFLPLSLKKFFFEKKEKIFALDIFFLLLICYFWFVLSKFLLIFAPVFVKQLFQNHHFTITWLMLLLTKKKRINNHFEHKNEIAIVLLGNFQLQIFP